MTELEIRLQNMKRYRKEALLDPVANKLYLEDLAISIPMFENAVKNNAIGIQSGWLDSERQHV